MTCLSFAADRRSNHSPTRLPAESWRARSTRRSLGKENVHVWFAFLDDLMRRFDSFLATLAEDEIEKVGRFRFQKKQGRITLDDQMARAKNPILEGVGTAHLGSSTTTATSSFE